MRKRTGIERRIARWGVAFVAPSLVFFSIFSFYPILNALFTGFFDRRLLSLKRPAFVGFGNYISLLRSADFWNSVRATFMFTAGTFIPMLLVSLTLAPPDNVVSSVLPPYRFTQMACSDLA